MLPIAHRLLLACRRSNRVVAVVVAVLAFVVLMGASPRVQADPAQARKHFEMGKRYVQVDEYRKAIEEFKAAHILEPDPAFLYNIAECYRRLGETEEALKFYRRFLALSPSGNPQRGIAEARVAELAKAGSVAAPVLPPTKGAAEPSPPLATPPAPAAPLPAVTTTPRALPAVAQPAAEGTSTPLIGAAPNAVVAGESSDSSPPFYRRGWFYGVVGAVLVGGALGVWAISSRDGTTIPGSELGNQPVFQNK